jgi:uracil-DNA glycosylase family 4
VGEAPGQTEDAEGRPFVGESGRILREALVKCGIDPDSVYITNAVKCATEKTNQPPNKKTIKLCRNYLLQEIDKVKPNVIAAFGAVALASVLQRKGITKLKNNILCSEEFGTKVIPIYHPAYVLRNPGALNDFLTGITLLASEAKSKSTVRVCSIVVKHKDCSDNINAVLDKLEKVDKFVFDLETSSLNFRTADILCVALSWKAGVGVSIRWDAFSKEQLQRFVKILRDPKKLKINQNIKFDLEMLLGKGIQTRKPYFDTLIAASLINENMNEKGLDALVLTYLDIGEYWAALEQEKARICKENKIKKDEFSYAMIPYPILASYARWDADATFRLYEIFEKKLKKLGLEEYNKKYAMETLSLLVEMEFKGVLVNRPQLEQLIEEYQIKLNDAHAAIRKIPEVKEYEVKQKKIEVIKLKEKYYASAALQNRFACFEDYAKKNLKEKLWTFNQRSVPQLAKLLFEYYELKPIKKSPKTNKPSTDKETLETYAKQDVELCNRILRYRKLGKYIATYLVSTHKKSEEDSRIHANYLQAKARTGRLCVEGATLVTTDIGYIPINRLQNFSGVKALTQQIRFMPITHVWMKGVEEMFEICTTSGRKLTCTGGHQLLTDHGWKSLFELRQSQFEDPVHVLQRYAGKYTCYETEKIVSIVSVGDKDVWDITVETDSSYFAEGLLSHNSCIAPNMQNIPRDAKDFKGCLVADPGFVFVKADLKQAEFRCWAHYSEDRDMINDIANGIDIHRSVASEVFKIPMEQVSKEQRNVAKACVTGDTWIPTTQGFRKIESIHVQDLVLDQYNYPQKVLETIKKEDDSFYVDTECGSLKCTQDHPFFTIDPQGAIVTRKLAELRSGDYILSCTPRNDASANVTWSYTGPRNTSFKSIHNIWTLDAPMGLFLGFFMAEGAIEHSATSVTISWTQKGELVSSIEKLSMEIFGERLKTDIDKRTGVSRWLVASKELFEFLNFVGLQSIGTKGFKSFPEKIFESPLQVQKAFIKGYFAGDGTFKDSPNYRASVGTVSKDIADNMCLLLRSFGIFPKIVVENPKNGSKFYNIQVSNSEELNILVHKIGVVAPVAWRFPNQDRGRKFLHNVNNFYFANHKNGDIRYHIKLRKKLTHRFLKETCHGVNKQLDSLVEHGIYSVKIKNIVPIGKQTVYDFVTTGDKVMVANGFYTLDCVFGPMYGRGAYAIAAEHNISIQQAEYIRSILFNKYPVAAEWLKKQVIYAHEYEYVKTWLGRYRRLPEINSDDPKIVATAEREALNSPIQGLASNMNDYYMCLGNKLAKKHGIEAYPVATQHDAQIFLIRAGQEKKMIKIMRYVVDHAFPTFRAKMELDFEVGETLGTLEPLN